MLSEIEINMLESIKNAFEELQEVKKGRVKAQTAREFLDEL